MAGTIEGGQLAALTNKQKYGPDFYSVIGAIGGRNGHTGGFADGAEGRRRARIVGALGGTLSRRGKKLTAEQKQMKKLNYLRNRPHSTRQAVPSWYRDETQEEVEARQRITSKYGVKRPW